MLIGKEMAFQLIGGMGFFFLGMKIMSSGLKKITGDRLRNFLHLVTKVPVMGVIVGAFITTLIQSSSATTVMMVGFVNAGLLGLKQAIAVIMGANIGTTFTAWLVSSMSIFKISSYALPAVGIGFAISSLAKTNKKQSWGEVIMGFGILFMGLYFMKDAFAPLKNSEFIKEVFITFSHSPWLGVLAGIIFTFLLQSSSATIAIVQILAFNGVISFEAAIPLILGDNIGTTITAQMAAVGTNLNARRAAMSHTLFNTIGVLYMLIFVNLGWFGKFIDFIIPGEISTTNVMFYIAVAHSTFNVVNTLVFLPFVGVLENISTRLVPRTDESIDFGTQYLEKHLLNTPSLALEQVYKEIVYMLTIAEKAASHAMASFLEHDQKRIDKSLMLESLTDNLQSEITQYIIDLSKKDLLPEEAEAVPVLIHNVNDIERIGDHSQSLAELARREINEELSFNAQDISDVHLMWEQIQLMFEEAHAALKNNDIKAAKLLVDREKHINKLQEDFKQSHFQKINQGEYNLDSGFIFLELIDNLEKIGDRLTNLAQSVIGKMKWEPTKKSHL